MSENDAKREWDKLYAMRPNGLIKEDGKEFLPIKVSVFVHPP